MDFTEVENTLSLLNLQQYLVGVNDSSIMFMSFVTLAVCVMLGMFSVMSLIGSVLNKRYFYIVVSSLSLVVSVIGFQTTYRTDEIKINVIKEVPKVNKELVISNTKVKGTDTFFIVTSNGLTYNFYEDSYNKTLGCADYKYSFIEIAKVYKVFGNSIQTKYNKPVVEIKCL